MDDFDIDFMDFVNVSYTTERELAILLNRETDFYHEFLVCLLIM